MAITQHLRQTTNKWQIHQQEQKNAQGNEKMRIEQRNKQNQIHTSEHKKEN